MEAKRELASRSRMTPRNQALCPGIDLSLDGFGSVLPIMIGYVVQTTGSYFRVLRFFGACGLALLVCSLVIDYRAPKKTPSSTALAAGVEVKTDSHSRP